MRPTSFPISRRRLLVTAVAGTLVLAACGSDADSSDDGPDATLPPADTTDGGDPSDAVDDADGGDQAEGGDADAGSEAFQLPADGAVLELGYYGGFTLREIAFQQAPQLLVTADGRLIEPAAVPAIYPGPMLPQHRVSSISPAGVQQLLEYVDDAGLLTPGDYSSDSQVADASTATLVVTLDSGEVRHEAYALGLGGPPGAGEAQDSDRARLDAALNELSNIRSIVDPAEIGSDEAWIPDAFQIVAVPAGDLSGYDLEPRIVPWPSDVGVSLADSSECTEITREQIGSMLDEADQLTFFVEADVTYQLLARPAYPGRTC